MKSKDYRLLSPPHTDLPFKASLSEIDPPPPASLPTPSQQQVPGAE
jgi:hypothetical protein